MNVISTRGGAPPCSISTAIAAGLAGDGGLFVPERLPRLAEADFSGADQLPDVAASLLRPFFAGSVLEASLRAICNDALSFPTPMRQVGDDTHLLELFHGPTAAFKDVGARFLAAVLSELRDRDGKDRTILVATSGDTGSAVADAFFGRSGFRVVVLYPEGRVSQRQAHLLSCYGGNVRAFEVAGAFDDCQRMAKQAFGDREIAEKVNVTSANSISLGRLLPQMAYYAHSSLRFSRAHGTPLNYVVPTGNLGNALACLYARAIGLPIGDVVLATNDNRVLPEFFAGADYTKRPSVATLANAMDVGDPSNFERLRHLHPDDTELRSRVSAQWVDDPRIRARIGDWQTRHGIVLCPHSAAGAEVRERLRADSDSPWCVVATAHPAKFDADLEPPARLAELLQRPANAEPLAADYGALRDVLIR